MAFRYLLSFSLSHLDKILVMRGQEKKNFHTWGLRTSHANIKLWHKSPARYFFHVSPNSSSACQGLPSPPYFVKTQRIPWCVLKTFPKTNARCWKNYLSPASIQHNTAERDSLFLSTWPFFWVWTALLALEPHRLCLPFAFWHLFLFPFIILS